MKLTMNFRQSKEKMKGLKFDLCIGIKSAMKEIYEIHSKKYTNFMTFSGSKIAETQQNPPDVFYTKSCS